MTIPLPIGGRPATAVIGSVVLAAGAALIVTAVAGVVRHRTTIVPHRAVSTLLVTGAFRLSRNPMYTGLAIAYVGGALLVGTWWPLLVLPLSLLTVQRMVIAAEESYLGVRFGPAYASYRARTRRWL